jgi:vWA-MoxR associated protein C-terminal domain/vWA-MoxR associated protein middle region 0
MLRALAEAIYEYDPLPAARNFVAIVNEMLPEGYLTLFEKYDIVETIEGHCNPADFSVYYSRVFGWSARAAIRGAEDLVNKVIQQPIEPEELNPLIRLLELIADDLPGEVGQNCRRWADNVAKNIDDSMPATGWAVKQAELLRAYRTTEHGRAVRAVPSNAYIVFLIESYDVQPEDSFQLSCWLYFGEKLEKKIYTAERPLALPVLRSRVPDLIKEALELAEQSLPAGPRPLVEFILPREQMNLPVETWYIDVPHRSLATLFPVVIRDLDRQNDVTQRNMSHGKWNMINRSASAAAAISKWITCADEPFGERQLYQAMLSDAMTAVGLTFPPDYSVHKFNIRELLDSGIAVALWPHQCHHAQNSDSQQLPLSFNAIIDMLASLGADRAIGDLPYIIYDCRRSDGADAMGGVALLWDPPARIVKLDTHKFASPVRMESTG